MSQENAIESESENEELIVNDNEESLEDYNEKVWGKEEGGEKITDGYSFTGKKVFGKATAGLKALLTKGIQKKINGIQIKVLDARKQGAGLEIVIEITDKKERGKSVIKIYDSNPKKKTITISKSKGCDQKFVILLTEKIVKPLIRIYLSGQEAKLEKLKEGEAGNKCEKCNKQFNTPSGLKGHITKIHTKKQKENEETLDFGNETLNISRETEYGSEIINGEKNDGEKKENSKKIYTENCDNCDFSVNAGRKYFVIQHMMKHRKDCKNNCGKCDYICKDGRSLQRHMSDKHDQSTSSISPPPKKSKITKSISVESMDVETFTKEEEKGDKLQESEEMEIDITEEWEKRSQRWDKKIEEKNERHRKAEEIELMKKKTEEEKIKQENIKKMADKKRMKQSIKNKRKRRSKQKSKN